MGDKFLKQVGDSLTQVEYSEVLGENTEGDGIDLLGKLSIGTCWIMAEDPDSGNYKLIRCEIDPDTQQLIEVNKQIVGESTEVLETVFSKPDLGGSTRRGVKYESLTEISDYGLSKLIVLTRKAFTPNSNVFNSIDRGLLFGAPSSSNARIFYPDGATFDNSFNAGSTSVLGVTESTFNYAPAQTENFVSFGFKSTSGSSNTRIRIWQGSDETGLLVFDSQSDYQWEAQKEPKQPVPSTGGTLQFVSGREEAYFIGGLDHHIKVESFDPIDFIGDGVKPEFVLRLQPISFAEVLNDKNLTTDSTIEGTAVAGDPLSIATSLATKVNNSEKAQANGIPTLDAGGKVPLSQINLGGLQYLGHWDPSTNTPPLVDGTGNAGDYYICTAAGTIDLGSGSLTFAIGDTVIYNGAVWEQQDAPDNVISVAGKIGVVILVEADITNLDKYSQAQVNTLLLGKKDNFSENTAFNKNFGTTSLTVCVGNDLRLAKADSALQNGDNVSELANDAGYMTSAHGELYRTSAGTLKLKSTAKPLEFDTTGIFSGVTLGTNVLTPATTGAYKVSASLSAITKRDVVYTLWVRVNGVDRHELGCIDFPEDNYCQPISFDRNLSFVGGQTVELMGEANSGTDKDFKLQLGSSFSIVKI